MTDGGIWALGGYLYQTIGALGIGAFIINQGGDPLILGSDLDLLIQLFDVNHIAALRIQPEAFNNDALITCGLRPTDRGVFVQFKYSRQVPVQTIGPAEIREIVKAFDNSVARAREVGENITACVLVTNRGFAQGDGSGGECWQEEKNNRQGNYELREIAGIVPEVFTNELINYARQLGVLEQEIDGGIRRLVGGIIIQAVNGAVDTNSFNETLNEGFTNYRQTKPITVKDLNSKCKEELIDYGTNVLGLDLWNFEPIMRKAFDELAACRRDKHFHN